MSRKVRPPERCRSTTQPIFIARTRMPAVMRPISTQQANSSLTYQSLLVFLCRKTELKVSRLNQSAQWGSLTVWERYDTGRSPRRLCFPPSSRLPLTLQPLPNIRLISVLLICAKKERYTPLLLISHTPPHDVFITPVFPQCVGTAEKVW